MNPSCNLFLVGPTGAGKTSIGKRLAEHYGLVFVDLDQEIEKHCGAPVATIFAIEGEAGFRQREHQLLDACSARHHVVLATGAGAVLDPANRHLLIERGYVLWLQATVEQQLERLALDRHRPLLADGDREIKLRAMAEQRTPIYRELAELTLPGEDESPGAACERCIPLIDQHWQRQQAA